MFVNNDLQTEHG